jgi:D-alanyl-D-alanine carboxypeptidase
VSQNLHAELARLDLVTPATVVKLLGFMYASPARENWISLLPVRGVMDRICRLIME